MIDDRYFEDDETFLELPYELKHLLKIKVLTYSNSTTIGSVASFSTNLTYLPSKPT